MFKKKHPPIFDHFEKHAEDILAAAKLLEELFRDKPESPLDLAKKIKDQEHAADTVTHDVIKQMNTGSFILPLDREDILSLTKSLDEVIDAIDNCAEAFAEVYSLTAGTVYAQQLVAIILKSSELILATCQLLRRPSRHAGEILGNCIKIHECENEADGVKKESLKNLFDQLKEQKIDIPFYIAWSDIYHTLEGITDRAEDCANVAEQIVLKYG
ncbi:MAG: DUF47 domain-containing protein [Oligoflexales bacterium]|nr:DUF47 domain-containing protein [Oligoflexales bacterium]